MTKRKEGPRGGMKETTVPPATIRGNIKIVRRWGCGTRITIRVDPVSGVHYVEEIYIPYRDRER